jgi:hypothetical protein
VSVKNIAAPVLRTLQFFDPIQIGEFRFHFVVVGVGHVGFSISFSQGEYLSISAPCDPSLFIAQRGFGFGSLPAVAIPFQADSSQPFPGREHCTMNDIRNIRSSGVLMSGFRRAAPSK